MNLTFFSFPRRGLEETQAGQTPRAAGGGAGCEGRGRGKPTTFPGLPSPRSPPVMRLCWTFILFAEKKEVRFTFLNPTCFPHIPPLASAWARAPRPGSPRPGLGREAGLTVSFSGNSSLRSKRASPQDARPGPARPACSCLRAARESGRPRLLAASPVHGLWVCFSRTL